MYFIFFFFSSRRRHTRWPRDWSSDVCSSDLYMSDILGDPVMVREIGHIFATTFSKLNIDVVMTIATKGIPLAYAVASFLNVPVVIVRRDPKVIEGSSVSINYVSGSSKRRSEEHTSELQSRGHLVCRP